MGIWGLPLGSLGTKCHLGASPMTRHRVYYKGEGGSLPQVRAMVNFMSPSLLVARPNTKSALASSYALTNLLFGLSRYV